jgi:hypothetical protein
MREREVFDHIYGGMNMNREESTRRGHKNVRGDSASGSGKVRPSGMQFIRDPTGGTHDMDTSTLEGTPVGDFLLVGLFFVTCYGFLPVLITYGLWKLPRWSWTDAVNRWTGQNWAWTGAVATGVILIVWILVEVYYIGSPEGFPRFLQVTFAALGAVILALAFLPRTRTYAKLGASPEGPRGTVSGDMA